MGSCLAFIVPGKLPPASRSGIACAVPRARFALRGLALLEQLMRAGSR